MITAAIPTIMRNINITTVNTKTNTLLLFLPLLLLLLNAITITIANHNVDPARDLRGSISQYTCYLRGYTDQITQGSGTSFKVVLVGWGTALFSHRAALVPTRTTCQPTEAAFQRSARSCQCHCPCRNCPNSKMNCLKSSKTSLGIRQHPSAARALCSVAVRNPWLSPARPAWPAWPPPRPRSPVGSASASSPRWQCPGASPLWLERG